MATMTTRRMLLAAVLMAGSLAPLPGTAQRTLEVRIQEYQFLPPTLEIQVGDSVRWVNHEKRTSHSVLFPPAQGGESERFFPGESWTKRFDTPGQFAYRCGPHPDMAGTVVVGETPPQRAEPGPWQVRLSADGSGLSRERNGEAPQRVALRDGLLPQLHTLANGQDVLVATRSGWVMRVNVPQGRITAELKTESTLTSTALSAPLAGGAPAKLMLVSDNPPALLFIDEHLRQAAQPLPLRGAAGELASGALPVLTAAPRSSFVVALQGVGELWEISYNPTAPDIGLGLVHDFQYREGHFVRGFLNAKRTRLACPARGLALSPSGHEVLTLHDCTHPGAPSGPAMLQITHLDVRKPTAQATLPCLPSVPATLAWVEDTALAATAQRLGSAALACQLP
jgi:plastocyanin